MIFRIPFLIPKGINISYSVFLQIKSFFPFSNRPTSEGGKENAKSISEPKLLDQYIAKADYVKEGRNETSLREGQVVQVIEKTETGKPFDINISLVIVVKSTFLPNMTWRI